MASRKTAKDASILNRKLAATPTRDAGWLECSSEPAGDDAGPVGTSTAALTASEPYTVRHNYPSS